MYSIYRNINCSPYRLSTISSNKMQAIFWNQFICPAHYSYLFRVELDPQIFSQIYLEKLGFQKEKFSIFSSHFPRILCKNPQKCDNEHFHPNAQRERKRRLIFTVVYRPWTRVIKIVAATLSWRLKGVHSYTATQHTRNSSQSLNKSFSFILVII